MACQPRCYRIALGHRGLVGAPCAEQSRAEQSRAEPQPPLPPGAAVSCHSVVPHISLRHRAPGFPTSRGDAPAPVPMPCVLPRTAVRATCSSIASAAARRRALLTVATDRLPRSHRPYPPRHSGAHHRPRQAVRRPDALPSPPPRRSSTPPATSGRRPLLVRVLLLRIVAMLRDALRQRGCCQPNVIPLRVVIG
jgi:hypothetical protein